MSRKNTRNTPSPSLNPARANPRRKSKKSRAHDRQDEIVTSVTEETKAQHASSLPGVLVLNGNFEPLNICSIARGMTLIFLGKAEVLRYSEARVRSAEDSFAIPSVLRLHEVVRRPLPELKISRKSVLARDSYTCVYCGSRETLTIDHVFPRHRGGENTWENVVCSCLKCNNKKGNRTPQECGMRLPHPPRKPRYIPYISFPRFVSAVKRPEWREFLVGFGKGLDLD